MLEGKINIIFLLTSLNFEVKLFSTISIIIIRHNNEIKPRHKTDIIGNAGGYNWLRLRLSTRYNGILYFFFNSGKENRVYNLKY